MTPALKGLRVTPIPGGSQEPAPWYAKDRPCRHCKGRVMYRSEHATVTTITVQHQMKCPVLRGGRVSTEGS